MSAKKEIKELFLMKFGPASASMLNSISTNNDESYIKEAYQMLSIKVGPSVATSFMQNIMNKYNVKGD